MKKILAGAMALSLLGASVATAQPGGQHRGWGHDYGSAGHHWNRGDRVGYNDWSSAQPVDYRQHHLRKPPRGYEWRQSNGQYILAAVATGVIASIILNAGH